MTINKEMYPLFFFIAFIIVIINNKKSENAKDPVNIFNEILVIITINTEEKKISIKLLKLKKLFNSFINKASDKNEKKT